MDVTIVDNLLFMVPIAGLVALGFGIYFFRSLFSKETGSDEMREISDAIRDGAMAYLSRQYRTIGIISVILTPILGLAINWPVAAAFLIGAFFSALSGFIGMYVSVNANIRTASAARNSLKEAFTTSFRGGAISGIAVASLSLLGVFALIMLFDVMLGGMGLALEHIVGYAFGASLAALFAQLGGGIYTKAADVGADLVGKVEAGIPEDDPRNPAVIADLVGDNVGDCAGRGADIFESTAAEIIGSMIIGFAAYKVVKDLGLAEVNALAYVVFPLVLMAFGLIASLIGISLVRLKDEDSSLHSALNFGYFVTAGLSFLALVVVSNQLLGDAWLHFVGCGAIGIVLGVAIVYITQYYTSGDWRPVKEIAKASETGPATNIISGFAMGLETTVLPVIAISLTLVGSFLLGQEAGLAMGLISTDAAALFVFGLYGTAVATIAMLASAAFILAEDTFGPIADNAGGIIEMSHQPDEIRDRTDRLDSAGNTTKALTKGYAMASAGLAAFLLFAAYFEIVANLKGIELIDAFVVNLGDPTIFVAGLIGGMLVFIFSGLAIRAVGNAAFEMINEVRRQFREIPGIMEGTGKPRYDQCVDIATKGALRAMVLPAMLPIIVPVALGLIYRFAGFDAPAAVGALIMVGTMVGILMANLLNNGGGAWDNAKKYIEEGNHGGKGSPAHAAAVVGDTIGDPFKDTAGPSIHVLVKLLATISLVTASLFVVV